MLGWKSEIVLEKLMRQYGRWHAFTRPQYEEVTREILPAGIADLTMKGYLRHFVMDGSPRWAVTRGAAEEYATYLTDNGPFGATASSDEEMALDEAVFRVPVYEFKPHALPGEPCYDMYFRHSLRWDGQLQLSALWREWVATQSFHWTVETMRRRPHVPERQTGERESRWMAGYLDWIGRGLQEGKPGLPYDVWHVVKNVHLGATLHEDVRGFKLNAVYVAGGLRAAGGRTMEEVRRDIARRMTGVRWDPDRALRGDVTTDRVRRDFQYLHYKLGGTDPAYHGNRENPFRTRHNWDAAIALGPRGILPDVNLEAGTLEAVHTGRPLTQRQRAEAETELTRLFLALPPLERSLVTAWRTNPPPSWKGTWSPDRATGAGQTSPGLRHAAQLPVSSTPGRPHATASAGLGPAADMPLMAHPGGQAPGR
ncbi:hypothetical protein [Streptomyces capillispiralis]|uniref:Uncharacterized protein n=1 Tax=Streptomyces capillispiralis TaxID=68182 RepID=A0A561SGW3_9ACTN|nr:hypothetical protein [Streptomyces capillispiralis]TWF74073.1 hypothetical protein FHX78_12105 [Streptomyces capillispiralis]GHH96421.1 hypothetical protein GCM10017779_68780 [Streptomyces capillispiralis]